MQNKIDKIKEFYSYDELMGLYFEWLDNNRYDRPLDSYEAQQYLHSLDVEELGNNIDYEQNEWWIDRHKTLEELKAGTDYNIIKKIRVEKQPRTVYTKTFNFA